MGSYAGTERYYYLLISKIRELGLRNVYFAKTVPNAELIAFYKCSDIFLCMSEHEGFCIPIIESMLHNLPVVAYSAAAVPETMDGAGIIFNEKKYAAVAEMMGELLNNKNLYDDVVQQQRNRIDLRRIIDNEQVLITNLSKGRIGEDASNLLALVFAKRCVLVPAHSAFKYVRNCSDHFSREKGSDQTD